MELRGFTHSIADVEFHFIRLQQSVGWRLDQPRDGVEISRNKFGLSSSDYGSARP
jgi:hypothetical protein